MTPKIYSALCFTCPSLFSFVQEQQDKPDKTFETKFTEQSGLSYQEVFNLAKNTMMMVDLKSHGNGLEYYIKSETNGKLLMEGKALI